MTETEKRGIEERRARDLEKAVSTLRQKQEERIYGVVSFHLQAGRIVRAEVKTSEQFTGG